MNLFVIGDHNEDGDPTIFPALVEMFDQIQDKYGIVNKIITFHELGICDYANVYAEEEDIPYVILDNNKDHRKLVTSNSYLRGIVDRHKVDAFLFVTFDKPYEKRSQFEINVRNWLAKAKKDYKRQTVFICQP